MTERMGWILVGICVGFALFLFWYSSPQVAASRAQAVSQVTPAQKFLRDEPAIVAAPVAAPASTEPTAISDTADMSTSAATSPVVMTSDSRDQALLAQAEIAQYQLPLAEKKTDHITTPDVVRALYMSAWVAGTNTMRDHVIDLVGKSKMNAIVVDIKDATGNISYSGQVPLALQNKIYSKKIGDLPALIKKLHDKNIYVIGRLAVFQDPLMSVAHPDWAVRSTKDPDSLWHDKKGIHWIDPGSEGYWHYISDVAHEAYDSGFDEINLDYVRYPSDGDLSLMLFQASQGKTRRDVIKQFFIYMDTELRQKSHIPLTADVFGLTTTLSNGDDAGIGQVWDNVMPHVDALCPMIYPSHYAPDSFGYHNPADHPYEMITHALQGAIDKNTALGEPITKIRPWIQDFDLGAIYDTKKVSDEIRAASDLGVNSWLSWDPANQYTPAAYAHLPVPETDETIASDSVPDNPKLSSAQNSSTNNKLSTTN